MIRYCLAGLILMACTATGPASSDPPIAVFPEVVRETPQKVKPIRTKHSQPTCNETFEDKRQEILYKLDCVNEGTGGA